jgi:restriction system protein
MATPHKDRSLNPLLVFPAVVLCWAIIRIFGHLSATIFILIFAGIIGLLVYKTLRPRRLRAKALVKVGAKIDTHMQELLRRRAQLVRTDPYGKVQLEKWTKEAEYFVRHHIMPVLTRAETAALAKGDVSLSGIVQRRVERSAKDRPTFSGFSDSFTPSDFEMFCAAQLRSSGWEARVTLQSRDQGVDVIAEKSGVRVVFQCKLYTSPVGNKAVQEIAAGRAHEQAHYAAVVTNHRYTSAAEQLASTNEVLLLHYSDLPNFERVLARSRADSHI